jgi:uncharacterized protein YcfJ
MFRKHLYTSWALVGTVALGGCAVSPTSPSVMVLPGPLKSQAQFQADNSACQQQAHAQVAPGVEAANNQAAANAVIGTAIGAAVGALVGYGGYGGYGNYANQAAAWGAGTGLVYGGAVGGSNSQAANYGLQQRYDAAFAQCMYVRGNQVPGQVSHRRVAPAVPPPPPGYMPPNYPPRNALPPDVPPPNTPPPVGAQPPG